MIEFILGTFLYAKHKKLNIKPIFYSWEIYLPLFCAVFYIFLEVTVWARWYFFIPYSNIIKIATLLSYIPLALKYNAPLLKAGLCLFIGSQLNLVAIKANSGFMPVFPSLSYWTGYTTSEMFMDGFHILGDITTKAIPLTDIFDTGYCIMSLGDILEGLKY